MEIEIELQNCSEKIRRRLQFIEHELQACPDGRLVHEKHRGKEYLLCETVVRGKKIRHSLTKMPETVRGLIRKVILEDEAASLKTSLEKIQTMQCSIFDFDLDESVRNLTEQFESLDAKTVTEALSKDDDGWAEEPYDKLDYKNEEKRHWTSRGLKLRSKSEVLIAEKLYEYGLPFRYEQVLDFGSVRLSPDFTIRRDDGKLFYWEHEGLTNLRSYTDWQQRKAVIYAGQGIVPWENLIVTYDNEDGCIDIRIIESEIKNKLVV